MAALASFTLLAVASVYGFNQLKHSPNCYAGRKKKGVGNIVNSDTFLPKVDNSQHFREVTNTGILVDFNTRTVLPNLLM